MVENVSGHKRINIQSTVSRRIALIGRSSLPVHSFEKLFILFSYFSNPAIFLEIKQK